MTYLSPHRCRGAARGYAASWVNSREQGRVNSRERLRGRGIFTGLPALWFGHIVHWLAGCSR